MSIRDKSPSRVLLNVRFLMAAMAHDQEEALALADRVVVLGHGKIINDAATRTVFDTR